MKYLKLFEQKNLRYEIGDYVYYRSKYYKGKGKIIDTYFTNRVGARNISQYLVNGKTFMLASDTILPNDRWIVGSEIKRKLTPKEIEDYETEISANKYNL
jgi:hypothetical protein